jgi:protocatechuate 3,4-dioxygenase beta subunit
MRLSSILILLFAVKIMYAQNDNLPECEWCGANEAPDSLSWKTVIPDQNEPGETLIITGSVYRSDGKTTAPDIILYAYHTNSQGIYPKKGDETGNGQRHGYLRSWMRTNKDGQYQITTIKPGSYPTRSDPAHIHITIKEPDKDEYWIDSIVFEGDPLITESYKSRLKKRGGSGIISLTYDEGIWRGMRNIILED